MANKNKNNKNKNNYIKENNYDKKDYIENNKQNEFFVNSGYVPSGMPYMSLSLDGVNRYLSIDSVMEILKNQNNPSQQLLIDKLSDYFYNTNGIYSSMIEKAIGINTFDRIITAGKNEKAKKQYISVLRNISEEYVGKTALRNAIRYGCYFGYLSYLEKNDNADGTNQVIPDDELQIVQFSDISIIPFNPKYIKILATDGKTYRIGIDLSMLTMSDIEGFPREIYEPIKKYKTKFDSDNERKKKQNIKKISKQYYILDDKKTIVIKLRSNPNESCGRAPFVNAIVQLIYDKSILTRQNSLLNQIGKTLVYETYPEGSKGKGTSALTKGQMNDQHEAIADALRDLRRGEIGFCSLYPSTNVDKIDISENLDSLSNINSDDIIQRISTHSGFSMGLLNGENIKNDKVIPLVYEILSSEFDDFKLQWQKEINKVLSNCIIKNKNIDILETPFIYYLPTNRLNRKDYTEIYHKSFIDAGGSYQLYLASTGVPAEIQIELMEEEEKNGYREKYPAHPMASTSSSKNNINVNKEEVKTKIEEAPIEENKKENIDLKNKNKKNKKNIKGDENE